MTGSNDDGIFDYMEPDFSKPEKEHKESDPVLKSNGLINMICHAVTKGTFYMDVNTRMFKSSHSMNAK